ncbi:MAG: helix-turn-helix domain-containing protein [Actinomycetia bacterium]|nr:helix-turn-helix domain-containing protein [Actinomycetes bacterium]
MPTAGSAADEDFAARVLPIVGANVSARRNHLGLSQRELSEQAGVDRMHVRAVELGTRAPTVIVLAKLAKALDTTVTALTKGT